MATQNLVSATLSAELKNSIVTKISELKTLLNFTVSLLPEEKKELVKVGNSYLPFVDKAYRVASDHPEIIPSVFDKEEFVKDYQFAKDLSAIAALLDELNTSVDDTLCAANSDTMVAALEIYSAVQQNKDKVPGLDVANSELKEFFKKSKRNASAKTNPTA